MTLATGTPDWWLHRLGRKLSQAQPRYERLEAYAIGLHPLPIGNEKMRDTFRKYQKMARANFTGLVSESVRERLHVTGFSTGGEGDAQTDKASWECWQRNQMDADFGQVLQAALEMSRAYAIVGRDGDKAVITGEDPRNVIHESDPVRRRVLRAALKSWVDEVDERMHAVLYLPEGVVYYLGPKHEKGGALDATWEPSRWKIDESQGDAGVAELPTPGVIPVVPFLNRPRLRGASTGEFEDVTDIQDRINVTILDRLVIQAMQAYRQRWMTGVDTKDEKGVPERPFDPGADLVWAVEDEKAKFGDFEQADIGQILNACKEDIRQLAAITRTPPHYLVGELNNVNGETLKATETGLVAKCSDRKLEFGESIEAVIRQAGAIEGRDVAPDAEVIWAESESRSMAELADAAVKKQSVGVPWRQNMTDLGYSPTQIERMESERAVDALVASLATPPPAPAPAPPPGATVTP